MSRPNVTVGDFMTACRETIEDDDLLAKAGVRMAARKIRYLPVVHDDRLVGILSDRDVELTGSSNPRVHSRPLLVRDAMTELVLSCGPDANLRVVANEMVSARSGSAVIIEGEHPLRVLGVLTVSDALRGLTERTSRL
jgi:CBS domain-containing protein